MTTTEHSGSGDVSRSLELLWGLTDRPSRGPKPGLTVDRIVTTAVAVADSDGLGALSMRRVATDLGVGTMSLYRYVPGKAELLDLMLDKVSEFDSEAHPDPAAGWRPALEALARDNWRLHQRHPWLLQVDQARPLLGPNALDSLEYALRALAGTGLTDREKIHVMVSLGGFITGTARTELNAALAEKRTGISNADFWRAQEPVLSKAMLSGRYPALAGLDQDTFTGGDTPVFELGLAALLDGFEVLIAARSTARTDAP
ncbi:TetR/AcrR family transcriptional regulator [Streptomyces decoyicus]|uniref:TetR/AcrR family transcriptional regulator n=1 Tax=Streptomyces decoyicus TaxID=249567 RepID=UPI0004AB5139|nr:TetR/AcrR family transcriptional regulator [Streptomyces decoyicus]KOG44580.1 TetR family transcriptional regulator [Streptomyces decoyicus]QZY17635.1 TetR/AcrR family transcriptional regulator [Streptomyces decoyicus]